MDECFKWTAFHTACHWKQKNAPSDMPQCSQIRVKKTERCISPKLLLKRQSFLSWVWGWGQSFSQVQTRSPCEFTAYKCSSVPPQTARWVDFGKPSTALRIFYSRAPQKTNYSGRKNNYVKCRPSEPKEINPSNRERLNGPFASNVLLYLLRMMIIFNPILLLH